jgi:hypothetical protein
MASLIESTASTRRSTKEVARVEQLFPDSLKPKAAKLIEFLKDYYDLVNKDGTSGYRVAVRSGAGIFTTGEDITSIGLDGAQITGKVSSFTDNELLLYQVTGTLVRGSTIIGSESETLVLTNVSGSFIAGESVSSSDTSNNPVSANVLLATGNTLLVNNIVGNFAVVASPNRKVVTGVISNATGEITGITQGTTRIISQITPIYDNPSYTISRITKERDIDRATQRFFEMLQRETAANAPGKFSISEADAYKKLMKYYSLRGSSNSIELFFKILYQDEAEVYYPYSDTLKPSSGTWNASLGRYTDNNGFLSDNKKIHDSYYYQRYSYVVKTGTNSSEWKDSFNRLVHPAGFIFFGQIFLLLTAVELLNLKTASKMPKLQPGLIGLEDLTMVIESIYTDLIQLNEQGQLEYIERNMRVLYDFQNILRLELLGEGNSQSNIFYKTLESMKFTGSNPIGTYSNNTINEAINNTVSYEPNGILINTYQFTP